MNRRGFIGRSLASLLAVAIPGKKMEAVIKGNNKKNLYSTRQKFFRGQRVRITKKLPACMSHFECDCDAIIIHNGSVHEDGMNYGLLVDKGDRWTSSAWYGEEYLTLIDGDRDKGEQTILEFEEKYGSSR